MPGAAVVVVRGDDTLVLKGYGAPERWGTRTSHAGHVFPLASCTKAFTTTLLAMLADDGLIGWDDPVRKHLPGFKLSDPNADALLTSAICFAIARGSAGTICSGTARRGTSTRS